MAALNVADARAGGRHVHCSSSIQIGSARPTIVVVGNGPKYRPSSECHGLTVHQENLTGRDHPAALPNGQRAAQVIAVERRADGDAVDADRAPVRQTVCPGSAAICFSSGTPLGR